MVRMDDGAVTFKGGTILKARAAAIVRARLLRVARPHRTLQNLMLHAACFRTTVRATWTVYHVGDTLHASCCTLRYVAWYVARCGAPMARTVRLRYAAVRGVRCVLYAARCEEYIIACSNLLRQSIHRSGELKCRIGARCMLLR